MDDIEDGKGHTEVIDLADPECQLLEEPGQSWSLVCEHYLHSICSRTTTPISRHHERALCTFAITCDRR
jgi:hypothetical protein